MLDEFIGKEVVHSILLFHKVPNMVHGVLERIMSIPRGHCEDCASLEVPGRALLVLLLLVALLGNLRLFRTSIPFFLLLRCFLQCSLFIVLDSALERLDVLWRFVVLRTPIGGNR